MSKSNYFIIFGKNGSVGKSLKSYLAIKGQNVVSISWTLTRRILNSNKSIDFFLKNEYQIASEKYNLIVINCLKESRKFNSSLELNKKFLSKFSKLLVGAKYIYFSTYEPNIVTGTEYRKIKLKMENFIINNNGVVIRIGYYLPSNQIKNNTQNLKFSFLAFSKNNPILVPVTKPKDLYKNLMKIANGKTKQLFKCYSDLYAIHLVPKFPFIILKKFDSDNKILKLKVPFEIISKMFYNFAKLLRHLKFNDLIISFLEKPYSLFLQQSFLKNKNNNDS